VPKLYDAGVTLSPSEESHEGFNPKCRACWEREAMRMAPVVGRARNLVAALEKLHVELEALRKALQ
jgi:hypothetical protein